MVDNQDEQKQDVALTFEFIEECEMVDPDRGDPIFPLLNRKTLTTEYQCPYCHYEWSGKPKPISVEINSDDDGEGIEADIVENIEDRTIVDDGKT